MKDPTLFDDMEYEAFCDKFKAKKTTDDCYTPEPVYNTIRDYVCSRYASTLRRSSARSGRARITSVRSIRRDA